MNYRTRHSDALRRMKSHGNSAVAQFTKEEYTHDPATETFGSVAVTETVDGYATEIVGDPFEYKEMSLTDMSPVTLLFIPNTLGAKPELDDKLLWAGQTRVVKGLTLFRPAGVVIGAKVIVV